MNRAVYHTVLNKNVLFSTGTLAGSWIGLHWSSGSKLNNKATKKQLKNDIKKLEWLEQFPDLGPGENL